MRFAALAFGVAALCAGCASPAAQLLHDNRTRNTLNQVQVCRDYGCSMSVPVPLAEAEWAKLRAPFAQRAASGADEREQIRQAIALMEQIVAPKAGTGNDAAGAQIINFRKAGQLDCIDEAYNTSAYLRLLEASGLLTWHVPGTPANRGHFVNGWPHNTATVVERGSGDAYAVDSWFGANGEMPDVVPLRVWLDGWHPPAHAA